MKPRRITFFGKFGVQNLGNECTLQAIIHNTLRRMPNVKLVCLCPVPEDTAARHNIPAFSSVAASPAWLASWSGYLKAPLRVLFFRIPVELLHWAKGFRLVMGSYMLIVPGTGIVSDYLTGPFGWPYELFKWSIIAKLCRARLLFVSIGVGPIYHPLSKWFINASLRFAEYRSFRDTASKEYMDGIGFHCNKDRVTPDLAFGLPRSNAYLDYLNTMAAFVIWLCEHQYSVRILIGDISYDSRVRWEFTNLLKERGFAPDDTRIIVEPVLTVDQLVRQLATTDIVISPRFHNLVLGLMLNKPVLALSDHPKLDSLMSGLGLGDYCLALRNVDVNILVTRLVELVRDAEKLKPCIKRNVERYREALDQEYSAIFAAA